MARHSRNLSARSQQNHRTDPFAPFTYKCIIGRAAYHSTVSYAVHLCAVFPNPSMLQNSLHFSARQTLKSSGKQHGCAGLGGSYVGVSRCSRAVFCCTCCTRFCCAAYRTGSSSHNAQTRAPPPHLPPSLHPGRAQFSGALRRKKQKPRPPFTRRFAGLPSESLQNAYVRAASPLPSLQAAHIFPARCAEKNRSPVRRLRGASRGFRRKCILMFSSVPPERSA